MSRPSPESVKIYIEELKKTAEADYTESVAAMDDPQVLQAHLYFMEIAKLLALASKTENKRLKSLIAEKMQSIFMKAHAHYEEMAKDGTIDEQMYLKTSAHMMESFNHLSLAK